MDSAPFEAPPSSLTPGTTPAPTMPAIAATPESASAPIPMAGATPIPSGVPGATAIPAPGVIPGAMPGASVPLAPLLSCQDLTKTYGSTRALDRFTCTIPQGRIVGLLGPNGSGKTTLLKLIAGVAHPSSGTLRVAGLEVGAASKSLVSYLPERPYFPRSRRVSEMVSLFSDFYQDFDAPMAYEMLAHLGVSPQAFASSLSKGTLEKVQLVLVMARHAALYLLDEPIGGVDPAARDFILQTIIKTYRPHSSILLSTHLVQDIESILDDFILLRYGSMTLHAPVGYVTETLGTSLDSFFRKEFQC